MLSSAIQAISLATAFFVAAHAGPLAVVEVPGPLAPASNESLAMIIAATGVQIYECRARQDAPAAYEWNFVAPEAELFDAHGRRIGRHFAGPRWEASDGSRIVGTLQARADAPLPGAVPWLLLSARSDGPAGLFSAVTSVQRVNTEGGAAPDTSCAQDTAGAAARADYRADYYFFTTR